MARLHSKTLSTTERLRELAADMPHLNLSEAGRIIGITRERVRQVANREGLPFRRGVVGRPHSLCDVCGKTTGYPNIRRHRACASARSWLTLRCPRCGRQFKRQRCQVNQALRDPRYKKAVSHCSRGCLLHSHEGNCHRCGAEVTLTHTQASLIGRGKQKHVFCASCRHSRFPKA